MEARDYWLRIDAVRSTLAKVLGAQRQAFVERSAATDSPYLELVGANDREIAAAMAYAAQRWGNDRVLIHFGGRHPAKFVKHAVAHGINVANRDSYIQSLVAQERARQAYRATRRPRDASVADTIAVVERAPSAIQRSG